MNRKAQTIGYEIFVAIFMLSIIFLHFLNSLTLLQKAEENFIRLSPIQNSAYYSLALLTRTPGKPSNWEYDLNIQLLGLSKPNSPNVIDINKLNKFLAMDYNDIKKFLRIEEYEFYFELTQNSTTYSVGDLSQANNAEYAISMQKIVDFNAQPAKARMILYVKE